MPARLAIPVLLMALPLGAAALDAQQVVRAGAGSVSATVRVGLVIPPRLQFRVAAEPRLQQRRGDTATYAMDVEVAANLAWTLGVVGADAAADAPTLRVKDHTGTWRTLCAADGTVTIVPTHAPSNWRSVRTEIQVVGRAGLRPDLTFDLQPAHR